MVQYFKKGTTTTIPTLSHPLDLDDSLMTDRLE